MANACSGVAPAGPLTVYFWPSGLEGERGHQWTSTDQPGVARLRDRSATTLPMDPLGSLEGSFCSVIASTLANSFRIAPRIASLIEWAPVITARRSTSSRSASLAAKPKHSRIGWSGLAGRVPGLRFVFMAES
jgi:hypothetical protein